MTVKPVLEKMLCALFAILLLFPIASFAEATEATGALATVADSEVSGDEQAAPVEEIQLLWDIPFGIGIDEFISLVKEKTGFNFVSKPNEEDGIRRIASLDSPYESPHRVAGYDISSISAAFFTREVKKNAEGKNESYYPENQEEALNQISIVWDIDTIATSEYCANAFAGLLYDLEKKYGEARGLSMLYYDENSEPVYCRIEKQDGYINTEDIIKALDNQERSFSVSATFHNITLTSYLGTYYRSIFLFFADSPVAMEEASPEPLPTYEETLVARSYGVGF